MTGRGRFLPDTNVALLLLVGLVDPTMLNQRKHKRVAQYDARDFAILWDVLGASSAVVFTPNILTEVSNLLRTGAKGRTEELIRMLAKIIGETEERQLGSSVVAPRVEFLRLGLTDDLDLYLTAQNAGLASLIFSHLQQQQRPDY